MSVYHIIAYVIAYLFISLIVMPVCLGAIVDYSGSYWTLVKITNALVIGLVIFVLVAVIAINVVSGNPDIIEQLINKVIVSIHSS